MLTFEGQQFSGTKAIMEKLTVSRRLGIDSRRQLTILLMQGLPFTRVAHNLSTTDAQPGSPQGSILVTVTGQLLVYMDFACGYLLNHQRTHHFVFRWLQFDDESHPHFFTQTFHLFPEGGNYFVYNGMLTHRSITATRSINFPYFLQTSSV